MFLGAQKEALRKGLKSKFTKLEKSEQQGQGRWTGNIDGKNGKTGKINGLVSM